LQVIKKQNLLTNIFAKNKPVESTQIRFCQQYIGLPLCKHNNAMESSMSHENSDFETSCNLRFSALEPVHPKLSSYRAPDKLRICVFYTMKTSKNPCIIRSECTHYAYILLCKQTFQIRSVSWFNWFIFSENICEKVLFFDHLQALKVRDLKFYVRVNCVV
jgi:hypothetical protein